MKTYVISGVTGMTGSQLARNLVFRGDRVIGFDNFYASSIDTVKDLLDNELFEFYEYDLNDPYQMGLIAERSKQFKAVSDEIVYVNCAAVVHTEHFYEIDDTFQTNVVSMKSFLDQAIEIKADTFINCSTSEVYSMQSYREGGVEESDFLLFSSAEHSQRTSYAAGKLITEFFMKDAVDKGKIRGCSLRFANVYSKNEKLAKHIIPHIIRSLQETGSVTLLENAKNTRRTFLHNIDSCTAIMELCDTHSALDGSTYNVGTDEEYWILDVVRICAEELGMANPEIRFENVRKSDPERRLLSTKKIQSRTAWRPTISLREGIRMCIKELDM